MRRLIIPLLLMAVVALPFLLRPKGVGRGPADDTVVIAFTNR